LIDQHSFKLDFKSAIKYQQNIGLLFPVPSLIGRTCIPGIDLLESFAMERLAGHFGQIYSQRVLNTWTN
jgi:hypothetical protein